MTDQEYIDFYIEVLNKELDTAISVVCSTFAGSLIGDLSDDTLEFIKEQLNPEEFKEMVREHIIFYHYTEEELVMLGKVAKEIHMKNEMVKKESQDLLMNYFNTKWDDIEAVLRGDKDV